MHAWTQELLSQLDAHHRALRDAVDSVPEELRGRRPATDRWSVAEVLEHLATVDVSLGELVKRAPLDVPLGDDDRIELVPFDRNGVLDRNSRFEAGERSQPTGAVDASAAWERVEAAHQAFREIVIARDGHDLRGFQRNHPIFGSLDTYQWIAFTGAHEERHALQIREIGSALTKP